MIHRRTGGHFIVLGLCACVAAIVAAEAASAAQDGRGSSRVTRADVAAAYLAFEEALADAELPVPLQRRVHRGFDYAASHYFSGQLAQAVEQINELTIALEQHDDLRSSNRSRAARSLQVQFAPPVLVLGEENGRTPKARIRSMYPVIAPDGGLLELTLQLVDAAGDVAWQRQMTLNFANSGAQQVIELDDLPAGLSEGTYCAVVVPAGSEHAHAAGRWIVAKRAIAAQRASLAQRLNALAIDASNDALQRAKAICEARLELLTDRPSPLNSIEFLLDPIAHARALDEEIAALEAGRNPYRNRAGEHWRIVQNGRATTPLMVYAPEGVDDGRERPLLVALHGAGGDETLFMRAYGAGMIRNLAEQRDFIVASALTYDVMASESRMDAIIADLAADYAIDRNRMYVIGHSLGGGTASSLLRSKSELFAAACCIAGAGPFVAADDDDNYPPVLVIAAELDTIITPSRLRTLAEEGAERGLPITYELRSNLGHVLVVNEVLEDAIDWLLQHAR